MPGLELRYVGQDRLATRLTEFDVERHFALTENDVAAINAHFRRDRRAGTAIQLVFLRASGHTLDHVGILPRQLLRYEWGLDSVPIEKQRAYAQRIQPRRPSKARELKASTRTIELICFLRVTLLDLTDALLYQTGRRVSDLVRQAYDRTTVRQARSAIEYRQKLVAIKVLVQDHERPAEDCIAEIAGLLGDVTDKPPTSHAASAREALTDDHLRMRNILGPLRELQFAGRDAEPSLRQLDLIGALHDSGTTELPSDCDVPVSVGWRDLVKGEDRARALRALEASAITGLRKGLRRGSVWINQSLSFRERDQLLIPPVQWEKERERYLSSLGLPATAEPFLERLTEHLKAGLAALEEAREAGRVTIGVDGALHLTTIEALPTDGIPKRTRDLIFKEIGTAQFADVIIEMDVHTGFSEVLLSRKARNADELIALYAALIAHGTEVDAKKVAAMIPQLDPTHISTAMRCLEMPGRLPRATERVVEFQRTHAITELWAKGAGHRATQ